LSIKNVVEMIKHNGLLASMSELEELYQVAIQNEQKLAELEARCVALAAENAGLKKFPDQIVSFIGKLGTSEIGSETKEKIEAAAKKIKTPGTDAFIAEVRANAIEDAASERWESGYVFDELNEFAAQIRKGV
jgi:hypothetical protein